MSAIWSASTGNASGAHIVVIHGSLDRSAGLLKLSRRLDSDNLVTRYDRRGYGRSSSCPGPFTMDEQVHDLGSVVRRARSTGVAPAGLVLLVGHSYGGNVALAFAERHPELVDGVVTYETPLSWRPWWPATTPGADAIAWRADPARAAERFMRRLIGDARWERLPESTRTARRREGIAMVEELIDLGEHAPWQPDRVTVPVIAMHGEFGADHHRQAAEAIASDVPHGRLVTLAGARHPGPNTHPDETAAVIGEFLRSLAARASPT